MKAKAKMKAKAAKENQWRKSSRNVEMASRASGKRIADRGRWRQRGVWRRWRSNAAANLRATAAHIGVTSPVSRAAAAAENRWRAGERAGLSGDE